MTESFTAEELSYLREGERLDRVNDNLLLLQRERGLTFGTDALLLAAFSRGSRTGRGLELGGGSGIVSLLLATRKKLADITCLEIQPLYADMAGRSIALNGLSERVRCLCADIRDTEAYKEECPDGSFDCVYTNPPYMTARDGYPNACDEKNIARHEVYGEIGDFCRIAAKKLRWGGSFYAVYRPDRLTDLICAMRENRLEPKRLTFVHADTETPPSMVLVEARFGGAAGSLRTTPPLCLYRSHGERVFTAEMQTVLDSGELPPQYIP